MGDKVEFLAKKKVFGGFIRRKMIERGDVCRAKHHEFQYSHIYINFPL